MNKDRRHMTEDQRVHCAAEIEEGLFKENREKQKKQGPKGKEGGRGKKKTLVANPPQGKSREPLSRDKAAEMMNVKPRRVQEAKRIKQQAPEMHEKVKNGEMTHAQANMELKRREKREALEAKADAAPKVNGTPLWEIRCGDWLDELPKIEPGSVRLAFADPPYNIGIDYGDGKKADKLPDHEYVAWCGLWIDAVAETLTSDGSFWLLAPDEYIDDLARLMRVAGLDRTET